MINEGKLQVPGELDVIGYDLPEVVGNWKATQWPDPDCDRLTTLREEFALDEVIVGCGSDFEALLALKRWVRSRWDHGWSRAFTTVKDGLDILREAARGEQFTCGFYGTVFVDCATALGFPARKVSVGLCDCSFPRDHRVGNVGHSVAEAWCNQHAKWIMFDPDLNAYYERDGVPLSALEIGDAWLSGKAEEVEMVQDEPAFVNPSGACLEVLGELYPELAEDAEQRIRLNFERFGRHRAIDYYARVRIGDLEWLDPRCPPTFVRHFAPSGRSRFTSHRPDLYPSLNMVRMGAEPSWDAAGASLAIDFEHCTPWFSHYEVRVDGGNWERCQESLQWGLHEGVNVLECRAVNRRGWPGVVSRLDVAYATPRW
ncbi:MAG: transglutaminase domain-containing protein [Armatimonadota bacterium]